MGSRLTTHQLLTLYLAFTRTFPDSSLMKAFLDTLPDDIPIPFQLSPSEIATFPVDVQLISNKLRENIDYLFAKGGKLMNLSRKSLEWAYAVVLSRSFSAGM